MEKISPHYSLPKVKALIDEGRVASTFSALTGAAALGIDFAGMVAIVKALTRRDFYKSMTSRADHHIWQDVYRPSTPVGKVYLKLTVVDGVLIVSFKEL
ncbi:type II toxin-antitoxin system MqsR family toxin [Rugamonas sp. DEMB1]|jgi:motility quorum-sensing regulator/GCU-specific mRNA interferase toxin|uniref:type II toxin-antitoxin system MqsR family toxin n=1 Tax=Rugamonas sp. DEMB1 TaxID=3039386 RepID=UPI00244A549C|nr:type II toxin-antitoxin system MqsR family toxin [Rugamonas sp. DEMB1]WGG51033.1 type II toxin-antitoxin system MqsR family toxin [Rugamonas sp. DEMB1]